MGGLLAQEYSKGRATKEYFPYDLERQQAEYSYLGCWLI